ncbi:MAG TPA: sigma-70 family RNA polymerase sigma factor [Solirubrobacteraceae bacterium]|nr:sigma-70 family RNA polymerase sigma factor [Solirubrobacteraceae bacterium]
MTALVARRPHARARGPEAQLLALAQQGDVTAFETLTRSCIDRLFAVVVRLVDDPAEAEDVVQEALLRAWRGIGRFRGKSAFFTWLYRIAINEAHRSLEKGARRPQTVDPADARVQESPSNDLGPARLAEDRELRGTLGLALSALPPPHRAAVILRDVEGLSTREAADAAGIGEAAFKSRLHQGRLGLRAALGDEFLIAAGSA